MRTNNYFISGKTPRDIWKRALKLVMDKGCDVIDEQGNNVREVLNLMTRINDPYMAYPKEIRERMLESYGDTLLKKGNEGFIYTYGERLRNWQDTTDQINLIVKRIRKNGNTRRATATTWIPSTDLRIEEVPCMILIDFKSREKLELTAVFRSQDIYGAYPYNLYALSRLLAYVSEETNNMKGGITILSISAHIYRTDMEIVKELIK